MRLLVVVCGVLLGGMGPVQEARQQQADWILAGWVGKAHCSYSAVRGPTWPLCTYCTRLQMMPRPSLPGPCIHARLVVAVCQWLSHAWHVVHVWWCVSGGSGSWKWEADANRLWYGKGSEADDGDRRRAGYVVSGAD